MKSPKVLLKSALYAFLFAAIVTGCGKKEKVTDEDSASQAQNGGTSGGSTGGTSGGTNGGNNGGTNGNTSGGTTTGTAYTFTGSVTGPSGTWTSGDVNTDNLLRVTIRPQAGQPVAGTGFTANYQCVSFRIGISAVGSGSTTGLMKVNGGSRYCPDGPEEKTVDLSSLLTPGHGAIRIKVSNATYDWKAQWCDYEYYRMITSGGYYYFGVWYPYYVSPFGYTYNCPSYNNNPLYNTHVATFDVAIQTNGLTL